MAGDPPGHGSGFGTGTVPYSCVIYMTSGFVKIGLLAGKNGVIFCLKNYSPDWALLFWDWAHAIRTLAEKLPRLMDACYLRHAASINIAMAGRPIVP